MAKEQTDVVVVKVKFPSPIRLLCGGALAYWLAHIINPAFVAIAVMIVLFIPIFITDHFSCQSTNNQSDVLIPQRRSTDRPIPQRRSTDAPRSSISLLKEDMETTKKIEPSKKMKLAK
jgi:hypothetical protein